MEAEAVFAAQLGTAYRAESGVDAGRGDFVSADHRRVIEFKRWLQSARDLHAAVLQLALVVERTPKIESATLVASLPKMSAARVEDEWRRTGAVLRSDIRSRMRLVAVASDRTVAHPQGDDELKRIETAARAALGDQPRRPEGSTRAVMWTPPRFEVWKVLFDAWLRGEPPQRINDLAAHSGCSVATVSEVLGKLDALGEIERSRSRGAGLLAFPKASLRELIGAAELLRGARRFIDASGRAAEPTMLLGRLERLAPRGVAVGGVAAARRYDPAFDLNGLPRLDVTTSAGAETDWIRQLDPALELATTGSPAVVLVVHPLARPELHATTHDTAVPLADRAEVVLDLYDLGLTQQADDFVRAMRARGPTDV